MPAFQRHHSLFALALYAAITALFELPAIAHMDSRCACGWGSDPTQFMWAMDWWPYAIVHGLNPFVTHQIWVGPGGFDLASATSIPGLAIAASPLTAVAGPLVAYNVITILALVAGAWSAYRLCFYVSRSAPASIVGGYLYGFSAYELGHVMGHMHLDVTFVIPALVLLTLKRLDGVVGRRRFIVLTALGLSLQLLISTEVTFTFTLMAAVALLCGWELADHARARRIIRVLPEIAAAYVVMAALCSLFLYYALTGPALARGNTAAADLLGFVIPPQRIWIGGSWFASISHAFPANISEQGTYLGLPVVLIVAAFAVQTWRRRVARALLATLAVAVVWSLGADLYIDGHPAIGLPWKLMWRVPLFDQLVTPRIGLYISLIGSIIVALWLAGRFRVWRWALAALAVVSLIPAINGKYARNRSPYFHARETVAAFFSTHLYRRYLLRDEIVMPLPFGGTNGAMSMLWQARTNMYFRMADGYLGYTPPDYNSPLMPALSGKAALPPDAAGELRSFVVKHGVSDVIVSAGLAPRWPPVLAQLGLRPLPVGGILLYRVPASWHAARV